MRITIAKLESISSRKIYLPIVILGMLLAAWIQYIQHGWINPDSVLYFESARLFSIGDWQGAVKVFNWPLYSLLIAGVHQITGLGMQPSAQLLSVIFFGITTFSFIKLIELAGGNAITMACGALILFSSQYLVGDVLEMLMRDQGFWAFYLTALVFFTKFYHSNRLSHALFWQLFIMIATLFRIEAINYLLFLPLVLLFDPQADWRNKTTRLIQCHAINIFIAFCIIAMLLIFQDMTMAHFGRLKEVFTLDLWHEFTKQIREKSTIMSEDVLGKYLDGFAIPGLLLTFVYIIAAKIVSATGVVNLGLAIGTIRSRAPIIDLISLKILKAVALIAIINMALIITKVFVLSGRYVVALSFIAMVVASFFLAHLISQLSRQISTRKLKWLTYGLMLFFTLSLIKNIWPKSEGYNYIQEAVSWVQTHNRDDKPVFYDDTRARYYAGKPFSGTWPDTWSKFVEEVNSGSIMQYDYLVISHSDKYADRHKWIEKELPEYAEIIRFKGPKSKKSSVVYKKS